MPCHPTADRLHANCGSPGVAASVQPLDEVWDAVHANARHSTLAELYLCETSWASLPLEGNAVPSKKKNKPGRSTKGSTSRSRGDRGRVPDFTAGALTSPPPATTAPVEAPKIVAPPDNPWTTQLVVVTGTLVLLALATLITLVVLGNPMVLAAEVILAIILMIMWRAMAKTSDRGLGWMLFKALEAKYGGQG